MEKIKRELYSNNAVRIHMNKVASQENATCEKTKIMAIN